MSYHTYASLRDERGYTDYRVAKETEIATATLAEWKKGTYKPKVEKLLKIADLFGVPVEVLIRE